MHDLPNSVEKLLAIIAYPCTSFESSKMYPSKYGLSFTQLSISSEKISSEPLLSAASFMNIVRKYPVTAY